MHLKNFITLIEFSLDAIESRLAKRREEFCLTLDIDIYHNGNREKHKHTTASRFMIGKLISEIHKFIEEDDYEVDFFPSEENFYLNIKPNKYSRKRQIEDAIKNNAPQHIIDDIKAAIPEMFRFTMSVDNTHAGVAYMIQVTKEELQIFVDELEERYKKLLKTRSRTYKINKKY
jgi:hypothetical protein